MAVGPSTTTTLNDLLPQITAEALFVASEKSIMRPLVRNYNLAPGTGKKITVPIYPTVTAAAVSEGTLIDQTEVATAGADLTVATNAIRALVSDLSVAASTSNVVADLGRLFGEAIARKIDTDLMALFNGFTTNTTGGVTVTATAAELFKAIAKLRSAGYDTSADCSIVLHPNVAFDVLSAITNTFANPAGAYGNEALRSGYLGSIGGVPVYQSSLVGLESVVGGSAGDYACALFHKDALGLAMIGDINIEMARRIDYLGTDVVASCHYAVGELYDAAGVRMTFDSTIA